MIAFNKVTKKTVLITKDIYEAFKERYDLLDQKEVEVKEIKVVRRKEKTIRGVTEEK